MKTLVVFLLLIVSVLGSGSKINPPIQYVDDICDFGDSITDEIKGKEFLYYINGHHGHI